jgi:NAD-reducing hydrogenase large subunit
VYRVGPLARLNIVDGCGTPRADEAWGEFRELEQGPVLSSFHYHGARLVEALYGLERMDELLRRPEALASRVRATAAPNAREGIGVAEAPRGTLIHHYRIDDDGVMVSANLLIATGHNNMAMNRGLAQVARRFVRGGQIDEGALNRCEAVIRTFDPCLSCSTHALGAMPLAVELYDATGALRDVRRREA